MATINYGPVLQGTTTAGVGGRVNPVLPAREAGDFIQVLVFSASDARVVQSATAVQYDRVFDVPGLGTILQKDVVASAPAGGTIQVEFTTSGKSYAVATAIVSGGAANPPEPSGNDALRSALLGISTGQFSGLPFNSGVNPAGRGGRYGSPDGYHYLSEVVATQRGVDMDIEAGFQYQNRRISDAGAWNDLIGMQTLDWLDPTKPSIVGMKPFPQGGSYTAAKNGAYDAYLIQIGQTIATKRPAGSTAKVGLRLAWEMNGNWYDHGAYVQGSNFTPVPDYVAGTQRIISKIREGAGSRVFFIQSWSAGSLSRATATYWGDDYADVIGIDVYDAYAGTTNGVHSRANLLATGLGAMFDFARAHGKLVSLDEWGGHNTASESTNGNDNPDFPREVVAWLNANRDVILYEAQFNDTAPGNVENNLWNTAGLPVQLPAQRAAYIAAYAAL